MHHKPSIRTKALMKMANALARAADSKDTGRSMLQSAFRVLMELIAFAFFAWAGFQVNSIVGAIVSGLCCLVMAAHFGGSAAATPDPTLRG